MPVRIPSIEIIPAIFSDSSSPKKFLNYARHNFRTPTGDLIRLLCVPWRHKKPQQRACIDSRMLSTTVAIQPVSDSPRATSGRPPMARSIRPSISSTTYAQFAEGLHFSAFHYNSKDNRMIVLIPLSLMASLYILSKRLATYIRHCPHSLTVCKL